MLLQFSVENYKCFKQRTVLSLEASSDTDLPNNVVCEKKERYLKVAALFGANAAGKSTLFHAITAALLTIRHSNTIQIGEPLIYIVPFMFDRETPSSPTAFEFVFIKDGIKYVYGFSATRFSVLSEYLYTYKTAKPSTIFERTDIDHYKFTSARLKRDLQPLTERNTENKLFLATATAWNCEATRTAYQWLSEAINTYTTNYGEIINRTAPMFEADADGSLHQFVTNLLREADINISDFHFDSRDVSFERFLQNVPPEMRGAVAALPGVAGKSNKEYTIETIHHTSDGTDYHLSFPEESEGTKSLFLMAPLLKRAFESGEVICIDEFDHALHPMLVCYLVGLFNNPSVNHANAQLIISTHTTALLSLDDLRRDQIYFVEKDRNTGISELYSLDEFSPRKDENVRKAYMLGRYGSIPDITGEAVLWD